MTVPQTLRSCCDELRAMVAHDNITPHELLTLATRLEHDATVIEETAVFAPSRAGSAYCDGHHRVCYLRAA